MSIDANKVIKLITLKSDKVLKMFKTTKDRVLVEFYENGKFSSEKWVLKEDLRTFVEKYPEYTVLYDMCKCEVFVSDPLHVHKPGTIEDILKEDV